MPVIVDIALATLCMVKPVEAPDIPPPEKCYPVLIGGDTPVGEYQLKKRFIEAKGYGGDVLQFKEEELEIYAIHRVWTLRPWEKRAQRLKNPDPKVRRITKGCINVDPKVYDELVVSHSYDTLTIK